VRSLLQSWAHEDTCNVYGTRLSGLFRFEHDEAGPAKSFLRADVHHEVEFPSSTFSCRE
jgi:hypothetical protein